MQTTTDKHVTVKVGHLIDAGPVQYGGEPLFTGWTSKQELNFAVTEVEARVPPKWGDSEKMTISCNTCGAPLTITITHRSKMAEALFLGIILTVFCLATFFAGFAACSLIVWFVVILLMIWHHLTDAGDPSVGLTPEADGVHALLLDE